MRRSTVFVEELETARGFRHIDVVDMVWEIGSGDDGEVGLASDGTV